MEHISERTVTIHLFQSKENTLYIIDVSHSRPSEGTETVAENTKSISFKNSFSYCNIWIWVKWQSSTHDKLIPRLLESFDRKETNNIINNNISNISSGNYLTRGKVGDIEDTHVKLVEMVSVVIVLIDELGHSGQLDVCRALINGTCTSRQNKALERIPARTKQGQFCQIPLHSTQICSFHFQETRGLYYVAHSAGAPAGAAES